MRKRYLNEISNNGTENPFDNKVVVIDEAHNFVSRIVNKLKKPKVITAIGMFYDLEDPNKLIKDAALALNDNGIFIAQLMCLKSMIEKNDLGNICHEKQ